MRLALFYRIGEKKMLRSLLRSIDRRVEKWESENFGFVDVPAPKMQQKN